MSSIVFLTPPAHGHINPTLPVIQELAQRGERVICYNTEEFRPQIEHSGAEFRQYPPSDLTNAEIARLLEHGNLAHVTTLILRATEQLLPGLIDELARERPDLIVFDTIALWGKMAAAMLNLRGAASIGVFVMDERQMKPRDLLRMFGQVLPTIPDLIAARRRLIQQYGPAFPAEPPLFPMRGGLNLVYTAQALQPATAVIDETFRFIGPSIDYRTRTGTLPFAIDDQEPLVYISLGTIHTLQTAFFRECFAAFADYPAQFIVAAGNDANVAALSHAPANFTVHAHVPQLEVLQHADAFISHGGMNSIHEALYYGVPLVIAPHQFEQLLNARRVAEQGAGLIIDNIIRKKAVTAAVLRQSLECVLSQHRYQDAANRLQQELRATGGYRQAADEIQAYIAAGRSPATMPARAYIQASTAVQSDRNC